MNSPTSGITVNSTDLDHRHLSSLNLSARECLSTEWTDEKHSMYLKSMEASFVDQLYTSLNSTAKLTRAKSTKRAQVCLRSQIKVHQIGSWENCKFDEGESAPHETKESHHLNGNQWTRHCGVGIRDHHLAPRNTARGGPVLDSGARMLYSSVGQEFSDQNFDEDNDEEAGSITRETKRPKIIAKSSSAKYQEGRVIPDRYTTGLPGD